MKQVFAYILLSYHVLLLREFPLKYCLEKSRNPLLGTSTVSEIYMTVFVNEHWNIYPYQFKNEVVVGSNPVAVRYLLSRKYINAINLWFSSYTASGSGGICDRKQSFGSNTKTLNTGIVTNLNYGNTMTTTVTEITLAHEIGHNFGSKVCKHVFNSA